LGLWICLGAAGCSNTVDATFQLVAPCSDQALVSASCQFVKVIVSALDPSDPMYAVPLVRTCGMAEGHCKIDGAELIGAGRMIDVQCFPVAPAGGAQPVARATSGALLFDDSGDGVDGLNASLLLGNVNGFVETTVTDRNDPDFQGCSLMAESAGRYGHASVVLEDGRVLTTGGIRRYGQGVEEILATAEIYDPATGEQRLVLGGDGMEARMHASSGRAFHTMTRLRDGRVLIVGGVGPIQQGAATVRTALRSAEIFDPATEAFTDPMDMGAGRAHHTATMLATGTVLIAGGATYGSNNAINTYLDTGVIFDSGTRTWTPVQNAMSAPRAFHRAVMLDPATTQGKVLVVGGENSSGTLSTADIFNPNGLQFYAGVDVTMARNRSRFCAVRLKSGRVLVAGGSTVRDDPGTPELEFSPDTGVEIYDPNAGGSFGGFTADVINLTVARMLHTCSLLDNGNVVVAGGLTGGGQATGLGELIRDTAGVYGVESLPDQLDPPRFQHTMVTLRNSWVMIHGGLPSLDTAAAALRQSILFVPPPIVQ
jgi:hypothetical protein